MNRLPCRNWIFLGFLALLAAQARPAAAANLLANPGFESGAGSYAGWFTFGSGVKIDTVGSTDNIVRTGFAASKIYGGFNGCPSSPVFNVGGYGQAFTNPTVGNLYTFSGYSYVGAADPLLGTTTCTKNRALAKVVFFDALAGGNELSSNEYVIGDGNSVTNVWNAFAVVAPAPAGAKRVEALILYLQPACDPGAVFVDDLSFDTATPAAAANSLVNGNFSSPLTTGWLTFGNVFLETNHIYVRSAGGCAKLFSTFVTGANSGMYQALKTVPGKKWQFDVYSLTTCQGNDAVTGANDDFMQASLVFRDVAGAEIAGATRDTVILNGASPLGNWTKHTVIATAPAGTDSMRAYIQFISPNNLGGSAFVDDASLREYVPVGVGDGPRNLAFELRQNTPNPFKPSTRIDFVLGRGDAVELSIFDAVGRRVATLARGEFSAGPHHVTWDGRSSSGAVAPAGLYQYSLKTSTGMIPRKMMRLH